MTLRKTQPFKSSPIYIHDNVNHAKLIDALKEKYNNAFQAKYTSGKLKIVSTNINFSEFKTICLKDNIKYHNCTINSEKTLTVVLKRLFHLPELRICNSLKSQHQNPVHCMWSKFPLTPNIRFIASSSPTGTILT